MSDFKPTEKQLQILERLKEVTEPFYVYSDQMIAIAKWIDAEFKQKGKANEANKQPDTKHCVLHGVSGSASFDCDECLKYPCSLQEWSRDKTRKLKLGECGDKFTKQLP